MTSAYISCMQRVPREGSLLNECRDEQLKHLLISRTQIIRGQHNQGRESGGSGTTD